MALATSAIKNLLCDAYRANVTYISLHTGAPGTTGANEATGGSPAYARKQTTWGAASAGVATGSQVSIDVPAGTFTDAGGWSAATGGTFFDRLAISSTTVGANATILITPTVTVS